MRFLLSGAAIAAAFFSFAHADETIAKNHAPIGVMGDHMHKAGESDAR